MSTTDTPVDNGVNVAALLGAREALTAAPEAAQFTWRANCTWKNGTHSSSTVEQFFGLGEEQRHRQVYTFGTGAGAKILLDVVSVEVGRDGVAAMLKRT